MCKVCIYLLIDPETRQVRYVGKSNDISKRYLGTWKISSKEGKYKVNWVKSLLSKGLKPEIEIVDEVNESEWQFWEKHYISLYKSWGFKLTNSTEGGEGIGKGYKMPPRSLEHMNNIKLSKINNNTWRKPHSQETKNKIGKSSLGRIPSEETKAKRKATIASWGKSKIEDYNKKRTKKAISIFKEINKKRKGKSIEEIYGIERANIIRKTQIENQKNKRFKKPVGKYTLDNVLLKVYSSVVEAGKDCPKNASGAISNCCKGKRKSVYKHIYKYIL